MNVFSRGIRNAFRNTIRTISIVIILGLSIGLSLTMLIAHQAVGNKISSIEGSVGNTITISPAGLRGFSGGGTPLTETEIAKVKDLPHVVNVGESLDDRLTTSDTNLKSAINLGALGQRFAQNGGESFHSFGGGGGSGGSNAPSFTTTFTPPVTVVGSSQPTNLNLTQGGGTFTLKSGVVFNPATTSNVALVGSSLASKNNLKVGSTFTAYSKTFTVVGIFDAGNTFSNNQLIIPLSVIQSLSDQPGDITSATVTVDSLVNVASTSTAISNQLGSEADVTNAQTQAQTTIAPLKSIQTVSLYSLIGAVIAGGVIILLTMIMIVRERKREIGVIKAIGGSNLRIMLQFMTEALTLTILGTVIGLVIGIVGGSPVTNLLVTNSSNSANSSSSTGFGGAAGGGRGGGFGGGFRHSFGSNGTTVRGIRDIHAEVGLSILLYGFGAAILIAIIGSALAAGLIAKIRPSEVMRAE